MKTPISRRTRATLVLAMVSGLAFSVAACSKAARLTAPGFEKERPSSPGKSNEEVIYGDDNRADYYDVNDAGLRALSESTVALMSAAQISAQSVNGMRLLTGSNYGASFNLCRDERFVEQNAGAFCSGFLIAPQIVVTAGHCLTDLKTCGETSFVFGYRVERAGALPSSIPEQEVYRCASLLHTQAPLDGADFAVVKLDRPVTNHAPLTLATGAALKAGDGVTLVGYPEGLPVKIAGGGTVRSTAHPGFFVANTDSYGGNSGSAVVNSKTHQVEGILVRGEKDFVWSQDGCSRSYRCKEDACRGEDVTTIDEVLKAINFNP